MALLEPLNEVHNLDAKGVRDYLEGLNGNVAFAALDFSNMGTVQPRPIRKQILRPLVLESERPDFRPDLLLNVLHLSAVSRYSCFIHTGYNLQRSLCERPATIRGLSVPIAHSS